MAEVLVYDGINPPVSIQTFAAGAHEVFTGAGVLGEGQFLLYSGKSFSGRSERYQLWRFDGNRFVAGGVEDLPWLGNLSAAGKVLLFREEPFVVPRPRLVRALNAGDWTSALRVSGTPPTLTVASEYYAGTRAGLTGATDVRLGPLPPEAAFGLVNQLAEAMTVFSLLPPVGETGCELKVFPAPGNYQTAISIAITVSEPGYQVFYRKGAEPWQVYLAPFDLWENTTLQYFARSVVGPVQTPIQTARYTFAAPPAMLDSDADGVPDFVELARGLDPIAGGDSDGDGFSDLEELLRGTDPASSAGHPPIGSPRLETRAVFDRVVTPRPHDGPADAASVAVPGALLRAFNLQGSLLAVTNTVADVGVVGVTNPAARLAGIPVLPEDRLLVEATELHFDIQTAHPDARIGRELVGIFLAPRFAPVQIAYTPGSGSPTEEANAWVAAASNAWAGVTREISKGDLTVLDTLTAVLVERKLGELLVARGEARGANLTLFPFRPGDAGRAVVTQNGLLSLEQETNPGQPAWRVQTIYSTISNLVEHSTEDGIAGLRAIAREIYAICSTHNNAHPTRFVPPVDALRHFLSHGTYDSNYLPHSLLQTVFPRACQGAAAILAAVPPRPVLQLAVDAVESDPGGPAVGFRVAGDLTEVLLCNADGSRYDLPDSFGVLPGSRLEVRGFADLPQTPPALTLEVISARLIRAPPPPEADRDGNLLVDAWEALFLGRPADPLGDPDGDGYSNLQEMLEGTDPRDPLTAPPAPHAGLGPPQIEPVMSGGTLRLRFEWPTTYVDRFIFAVLGTSDLRDSFQPVTAGGPQPISEQPDVFEVVIPKEPARQRFYLLWVELR